ncbi:Cohesin domain-containing protein [Candidatus Methanophagaceae archaeon]|nr:Cohesin domain-containing protein [Methanophagales archaeon]
MKNEKLKQKAIVFAICIAFLVVMSALVSAGDLAVQGSSKPKLEVTEKSVEPAVIAPGGTGLLKLNISEVSGVNWAANTQVDVEILNPDGCTFLESGSSKASEYLGKIDENSSKETSFNISAPDYAAVSERTISITVRYMEPRGAALYGPYYVYANVNFDVDTTTTVTISIGDYTVPRNENFTVNITVNQTVPITGVQLDLSFNPSLVSVTSVTNGSLLTQDGAEAYFINGTIDNTTGTLTGVVGTIIAPGGTVTTPCVFATIQMTSKAVEGTSSLDLSNVIIADVNATPEPTLINDGSVIVGPYNDCDVNCDLHCNVLDIILVAQHFGETGSPHWIREDVNKDGNVDVLDIIVIGQNWTG